jgi:O-acetylhomoserine (thiol)-lyase
MSSSNPSFETLALHAGQSVDSTTKSRAVPIYQTTSYVFDDTSHAARLFTLQEFGNIYTRLMNPTTAVLEERLAALEGGSHAVATSSGQAAETLALTTIAQAGDHIIASSSLYGGTYNLFHYTLPKFGIEVTFVDPSNPENFAAAIRPNTKAIYGETVGNPRLDTFPFAEVSAIAKAHGIALVIDNTTPSPFLVNPFALGANVVVHSLTKFIGGHGTSIGGIVIDGGNFDWRASGRYPNFTEADPSYHGLKFWEVFGDFPGLGNVAFGLKARVQGLRDQGQAISPFNSFLLLQGVETLGLRMERHSQNALAVAQFLEAHPQVSWVNYPGLPSHQDHDRAKAVHDRGLFGGIVGFGIKAGYDAALQFIDKLQLFSLLANIGDAKSLVIHPASTTHQQLSPEEQLSTGVSPDFIRLSVGIENINDILADLSQALG